jgi:hypothetical protein
MTTPDSSHARRVAEAAFAKRPASSVSNAGPQVVVVKRRKPIVRLGVGDPGTADSKEPMEPTRTPRVFRVDSPVAGSGPAVDLADPLSAPGASADSIGSVGVHAPPVAPTKRRRRTRHGEVTIIHPDRPSVLTPTHPSVGRREEAGIQGRQLRKPKFTEPSSTQEFVFGIAPTGRGGPSRYQALRAEIERLHVQAEAVRKVEAAQAVRWIKRAIADYGLSASDLGL